MSKEKRQETPSQVETKPAASVPAGPSSFTPFEQSNAVALRPDKLKALRPLTLEATSIARLGEIVCRTLSELRVDMMPGFDAARTPTPTATVDVMDVLTGQNWCLICNAVLASAFRRAGEPLAGRYFAIRAGEIVAGKRYRKIDVVELEVAE